MPLPIHELSISLRGRRLKEKEKGVLNELFVPFSRLGGLTRNQNSSLSNSPFAFKDLTEKRNTDSLQIFILVIVFHFTSIHFISK